jgi:integrase
MNEITGSGTVATVRNKKGKITGYRIRFFMGGGEYSDWKSGYKTIREARKALEQYRVELEAGMHTDKKLTVKGYALNFHEERVSLGILTLESAEKEKTLIRRISRYIGDIKLAKLEPDDITAMYLQMRADGESDNSLFESHRKLRQILKSAIRQRRIIVDPSDSVTAPSKPHRQRAALDKNGLVRFTEALAQYPLDGYSIAIWVIVATGMRRGEALGLTWDRINLNESYLVVAQTLGTDRTVRRRAKTETSVRRIPLEAGTVARLMNWKVQQAEYFLRLGVAQDGAVPVCSNQYCEFLSPGNFERWWRDFVVANGFGVWCDEDGNELPQQQYNEKGHPVDADGKPYSRSNHKPRQKRYFDGLKPHDLRHTVATHLVANGIDIKTVSELLGHASVSTTLDLYAHAQDANKRAAVELMASLFSDSDRVPESKVVPLRKAAN